MPTLTTLFKYWGPSQRNQARKRYKSHPNQKKEAKQLFADGMILCIENYLYVEKIHKEAVRTNKCIQ